MPRRHSRTTPQRHDREKRRAAFDDLLPLLEAGTLSREQAALLAVHVREEVRLGVKTGKSLARTNRRLARHREAADTAIRSAEECAEQARTQLAEAQHRIGILGAVDQGRALGARRIMNERDEAQQRVKDAESVDTMRRQALAEALDVHPDIPWPTLISHAREAHQWAARAAAERRDRTAAPEIDRLTAELEDAETRAAGFLTERDQAQAALERVRDVGPQLEYDATAPGLAEPAREVLRDASRRIRAALNGAGEHACEHGQILVEYQTVITRIAGELQEAETHRKTAGPDEWENCPACGSDHAATALRILQDTGAPSVDVLVDRAQLTRERDGWKLRATLAEGELRTLRSGIRALGGDPTQVQNLWAQLRLRNRQWADAKRERDEWAGRCGVAEAGEDVARYRAESAAAALGETLRLLSPVRIDGAVAFYQATEQAVSPGDYNRWTTARDAAERLAPTPPARAQHDLVGAYTGPVVGEVEQP